MNKSKSSPPPASSQGTLAITSLNLKTTFNNANNEEFKQEVDSEGPLIKKCQGEMKQSLLQVTNQEICVHVVEIKNDQAALVNHFSNL